ncbi:MAG: alkaline phosphatase family protein [Ktedonobacteraceae bacterium]
MANGIHHVFVLMLENRSFDHMFGFSGIKGTDAVSGNATQIMGLVDLSLRQLARSLQVNTASGMVRRKGQTWPPPTISLRDLFTSNRFNGQIYRAGEPADYAMPVDPGHEFENVTVQLCGPGVTYPSGGAYPNVVNSGFVASYVVTGGQSNPAEIMKCYQPSQLPVLNALAQEFVVCDNWYASLPGPTWPNRFFAHAASSGGLDHSPTWDETLKWETVDGFSFPNGTIFDRMNRNNVKWRLYAGDDFPAVAGLKGIQLTDIHPYNEFLHDVAQSDYPASYTFIEPSYGHFLSDYKCGTSQHPLDDVTRGEALIKCTYEAIRTSPVWNSCLLIITWDEHGGFFDHVAPPAAVAPGDTGLNDELNQHKFTFEQYGPRVPAVVISPRIPRNLIDHRVYDHASIPATLEACFGLNPMTQRDANANNLMPLVSLLSPRGDAPTVLPGPANSGIGGCVPFSCSSAEAMPDALSMPLSVSRPQDSVNDGNLPGFLHSALRFGLALSAPEQRGTILAQFRSIRTRAEAMQYVNRVRQKVHVARQISPPPPG